MAGSKSPWPLGTYLPSITGLLGQRTPGPLGLLDAADPNVTALLGDTPGPLGWQDGFDPTWSPFASSGAPNAVTLLPSGLVVSNGGAAQGTTDVVEISLSLMKAADSGNSDTYYEGLLTAMRTYARVYGITTKLRVAHFLAQIGHESSFRMRAENGNYSAKRMREVFGCKGGMKNYDKAKDECTNGRLREKLWTEEKTYAGNADKLLSFVYASRMGNGNEASGDGYKYRGRGMMQLTGRSGYRAFTVAHNAKNAADKQDFEVDPDKVAETAYGVESAFFYWDSRNCNTAADSDNLNAVTTAVNGGLNGLADRKARLDAVKKLLAL